MDILAIAKELGEAIGSSEQMTRLKSAEDKVEQDEKAGTLLEEYKQLQIELARLSRMASDKNVIEDSKAKLMKKHEEVTGYDATREYIEAKAALEDLMRTVNEVIIYGITGEEPCSPHKCGSCGGGCK